MPVGGWGTGSVGSEPPERCLRPAQGSKTTDPSGAIIAICSIPVRARKSPCDTPRYWARYWAQVIAKKGKTYTGVSVRDDARRRLVFSASRASGWFREPFFHAENGVFPMACYVEVRRKSCETVGELRISLISFVTVCYLALRSER